MKCYHLSLFSQDAVYYQLRLFDEQDQLLAEHPVEKTALAALLKSSQTDYKTTAVDLPEQGQTLWRLINGQQRQL